MQFFVVTYFCQMPNFYRNDLWLIVQPTVDYISPLLEEG